MYKVPKKTIQFSITYNSILPAPGWMDGCLGFNGILSTQVLAMSCLRKFKVYKKGQWRV